MLASEFLVSSSINFEVIFKIKYVIWLFDLLKVKIEEEIVSLEMFKKNLKFFLDTF